MSLANHVPCATADSDQSLRYVVVVVSSVAELTSARPWAIQKAPVGQTFACVG